MFYNDHETVLTNGWIICRFGEISEVSGDFLLDFAVDVFLEEFTQLSCLMLSWLYSEGGRQPGKQSSKS